jgi:hypothetical protein
VTWDFGSTPIMGRVFSLLHNIKTGSGAHLASQKMVPEAVLFRLKPQGRESDNHHPYTGML